LGSRFAVIPATMALAGWITKMFGNWRFIVVAVTALIPYVATTYLRGPEAIDAIAVGSVDHNVLWFIAAHGDPLVLTAVALYGWRRRTTRVS
jgi:hypothetical protein